MISAMSLYYLGISLGYNVSINSVKINPTYLEFNILKVILKIQQKKNEIDYKGYVYDFTTDNHHSNLV